jgi:hypothetical protein
MPAARKASRAFPVARALALRPPAHMPGPVQMAPQQVANRQKTPIRHRP